jgi:ABC-type uncharacterized transport system permease subunit
MDARGALGPRGRYRVNVCHQPILDLTHLDHDLDQHVCLEIGLLVDVISVLENFSRALLASAVSPRQDVTAFRIVLRTAVAAHGASAWYYWWRVGARVIAPPFVAALALLFANALGAYATAYALVGGNLNILPIQIGYDIEGDLNYNPRQASALSLILAVVMALAIVVAHTLTQRAQRLLR